MVRRATGEKRVGHIGTLDPFATGLLVIALGKATRLVEYFQGLPKVYLAKLHLGQVSTSYDPEGEITLTGDATEIPYEEVRRVLDTFEGDILQTPPIFSAIKVDGKRAYKLARKGKEIKMPERHVHISMITIVSYNPPYLEIQIGCSSGTYIRSLGNDIGKSLGVGAYVEELKRISIDIFCLDDKKTLLDATRQDIDSLVIPLREIELRLPVLIVAPDMQEKLVYGVLPNIPTSYEEGTQLQMRNESNELLGIVTVKEKHIVLSKMLL